MKKFKMNSLTRLAALPLALALLLSGCGAAGKEAETSQPELPPENDREEITLTVSTYGNDAYLEEAATAFMAENENINIEITVFEPQAETAIFLPDIGNSWEELSNTPEQYVKSMNAALMSGRAADIVNMDVLPYYRYAESGLLADLRPYIERDENFNTDDYYANIFKAMEYKGGLYMLPTDYSAYIAGINKNYEGASDLIGGDGYSFTELAKTGAAEMGTTDNEPGTYLYSDAAQLFLQLYRELSGSLVNLEERSANFNSEEFFAMANSVKDYMNRGLLPAVGEELSPDNQYYFYYDSIWTHELLMPAFGYEEIYTRFEPLLDGGGKVYFTSGHAYALSEASANKEAAWEFMKFLLSERMQSSPGSFPIRPAVLEETFSQQIMQIFDMSMEEGMPVIGEPEEITANYVGSIKKWSGEINAYQFRDLTIEGIVMKEAAAFLKDEKTVEEAAAQIQSRVEIYLNEGA